MNRFVPEEKLFCTVVKQMTEGFLGINRKDSTSRFEILYDRNLFSFKTQYEQVPKRLEASLRYLYCGPHESDEDCETSTGTGLYCISPKKITQTNTKLGEGTYGVVYIADFCDIDTEERLAIKISRERHKKTKEKLPEKKLSRNDRVLLMEIFGGFVVNQIIAETGNENFVYTYGYCCQAQDKALPHKMITELVKNPIPWIPRRKKDKHAESGDSGDDGVRLSPVDVINIVWESLCSVLVANLSKFRFNHNDLYPMNILIQDTKEEKLYTYDLHDYQCTVKSKYRARIIDFGLASYTLNNTRHGNEDHKEYFDARTSEFLIEIFRFIGQFLFMTEKPFAKIGKVIISEVYKVAGLEVPGNLKEVTKGPQRLLQVRRIRKALLEKDKKTTDADLLLRVAQALKKAYPGMTVRALRDDVEMIQPNPPGDFMEEDKSEEFEKEEEKEYPEDLSDWETSSATSDVTLTEPVLSSAKALKDQFQEKVTLGKLPVDVINALYETVVPWRTRAEQLEKVFTSFVGDAIDLRLWEKSIIPETMHHPHGGELVFTADRVRLSDILQLGQYEQPGGGVDHYENDVLYPQNRVDASFRPRNKRVGSSDHAEGYLIRASDINREDCLNRYGPFPVKLTLEMKDQKQWLKWPEVIPPYIYRGWVVMDYYLNTNTVPGKMPRVPTRYNKINFRSEKCAEYLSRYLREPISDAEALFIFHNDQDFTYLDTPLLQNYYRCLDMLTEIRSLLDTKPTMLSEINKLIQKIGNAGGEIQHIQDVRGVLQSYQLTPCPPYPTIKEFGLFENQSHSALLKLLIIKTVNGLWVISKVNPDMAVAPNEKIYKKTIKKLYELLYQKTNKEQGHGPRTESETAELKKSLLLINSALRVTNLKLLYYSMTWPPLPPWISFNPNHPESIQSQMASSGPSGPSGPSSYIPVAPISSKAYAPVSPLSYDPFNNPIFSDSSDPFVDKNLYSMFDSLELDKSLDPL